MTSKIKQDLNAWRGIPCSWIGRLLSSRRPSFPAWSRESARSPSQSQQVVLWVWTTWCQSSDREEAQAQNCPQILKKKDKVGRQALPNSLWSCGVQTVWCWWQSRPTSMDQSSRPRKYSRRMLDRGARRSLRQVVLEQLDVHLQNNEYRARTQASTKVNSKYIADLNVKL